MSPNHRDATLETKPRDTFIAAAVLLLSLTGIPASADSQKSGSVFFPEATRQKMRAAAATAWGESARRAAIEAAQPWLAMSDDALWDLMFGPTITRSWMVWSNGHCPACRNPVPMYAWKADALNVPWKLECPHCGARFPKNDFLAFYRSGLDEHGIFDPRLADRSLLFNAEHPNKNDPLHSFGVDDGNGYVEGENRWRFIGTYLIYGQWKQAVLGGLIKLSEAYLMTGAPAYAHKAAILLDRVADLYPTFDFKTQAIMYEGPASDGYVSTWHDACEETRQLALAYDQVRDVIETDAALASFLAGRAAQFKLENRKLTAADIRRNIEGRILQDAVINRVKIRSNYPRTETALIIIQTVLGWPENRPEVMAMFDEMVSRATAVDGVTGEKGLAAYAASTIANLAYVLALYDRLDAGFLKEILARHPGLRNSYRFHYDTWFGGLNYPEIGDTGSFGRRQTRYAGANFFRDPFLPSMFTFFWQLYELTGDPVYVKILFHENGGTAAGLPFDLFGPDPVGFERRVAGVIAKEGTAIQGPSFNKENWHLAMLRSGSGDDERAVWLDYDTGGRHGHADGLNIGLFAKGLDLMPDFGYPPVQYGGGWAGPKAVWYRKTPAHNTVVIDGRDQDLTSGRITGGRTTLWGLGEAVKAIRVSAPEVADADRFERTIALVDISKSDSYVLDVFRAAGGRDQARFMHSHFGSLTTSGLTLEVMPDFGFGTEMRAFRGDPKARPGWSADWKIEDRYGYRPGGADLHLRLTDFTAGAQAVTAESWISASTGYDDVVQAWVPTVIVRCRAEKEPLASTFVGLIEPYEGIPRIAAARRLSLHDADGREFPDDFAALEINLGDGRRDIIVSAGGKGVAAARPVEDSSASKGRPGGARLMKQNEFGLRTDAELALVRMGRNGKIERFALANGTSLEIGDVKLESDRPAGFVEIAVEGNKARLTGGPAPAGLKLTVRGRKAKL